MLAVVLATPAQAASLDGAAISWLWALPFAGLFLADHRGGPTLFPKPWHVLLRQDRHACGRHWHCSSAPAVFGVLTTAKQLTYEFLSPSCSCLCCEIRSGALGRPIIGANKFWNQTFRGRHRCLGDNDGAACGDDNLYGGRGRGCPERRRRRPPRRRFQYPHSELTRLPGGHHRRPCERCRLWRRCRGRHLCRHQERFRLEL